MQAGSYSHSQPADATAATASTRTVSDIPSITALREILGYSKSHPLYEEFTDEMRVFRKKYESASCMGPDLHRWALEDHQTALSEMTKSFLEEHGGVFWPDTGELKYSGDSPKYELYP
jgi:hypothetical protein